MQPLASSGDCLQQHLPFGLLAQWEGKVSDWDPFLRMFAYIHPRANLRVWAQALAKSSDYSRPKMMEEVCDPMNLLFSRGALILSSKAIIHSLSPEELPVNL